MKRRIFAILAASIAPAALAQNLPSGYTCCNLHYDKDRISDANWTHAAMIPAGAPIRVLEWGTGWGSNEAAVEIDGKPYRITNEYGKGQESLQAFVGKLIVPVSPRAKIEGWPEPVRQAIAAGKVANGMTREQVIVAVSYPPTHRTPSLEHRPWHYWQSRAGRFEVYLGDNGTVYNIVGQKDAPPK